MSPQESKENKSEEKVLSKKEFEKEKMFEENVYTLIFNNLVHALRNGQVEMQILFYNPMRTA